jgi:nucleoside 2-deoxyribosyltransferase
MKVYLSGAIRPILQKEGRRELVIPLRLAVRDVLLEMGCEILCEHVATLENIPDCESGETIYSLDMGWVDAADCLIVDLRDESFGVGMEIERALSQNKPVLLLHPQEKAITRMLEGLENVEVVHYPTRDGARPLAQGEHMVLSSLRAFIEKCRAAV